METYTMGMRSDWLKRRQDFRGNKSHQFKTGNMEGYIYFDTDGTALNAADNTIFKNMGSYLFDEWHRYYFYNKTSTNAMTAINNFNNRTSSIMFEIGSQRRVFLLGYDYGTIDTKLFTVDELTNGSWYLIDDAY